MMKFLFDDTRTHNFLVPWAKSDPSLPLAIVGFFFWNSGSELQMSQMGLLRSLLYHALQQNQELIPLVFPSRWEAFRFFGESDRPWTWLELVQSFKRLVKQNIKICFFIDGLDEFNGDPSQLIEFFRDIISLSPSNIKFCLASRPWLVFEDALSQYPSLIVQDLTYPDIKLYVSTKFSSNKGFFDLQKREAEYANRLIESVVQKASGVFLWVTLVVKSLLEGFTNADRVSDIQRRLRLIPDDLEELFRKMLDSLDKHYITHASQLFQLNRAAGRPLTLLQLSFADEEDLFAAIKAGCGPLTDDERTLRYETMKRRLNSRCKGFLEVRSTDASSKHSRSPTVEYLHQTVKDFLEKPEIWTRIVAAIETLFLPALPLSRAFLWTIKSLDLITITKDSLRDLVIDCVHFASQVENVRYEAETSLYDELDRTVNNILVGPKSELKTSVRIPGYEHWTAIFNGRTDSTFPSFAVQYHLHFYLRAKMDRGTFTLQDRDIRSLLFTAVNHYRLSPDEICKDDDAHVGCLPSPRIIKLLLEWGADPNHYETGHGIVSPFYYALKNSVEDTRTSRWKDLRQIDFPFSDFMSCWSDVIEVFIQYGAFIHPYAKLAGEEFSGRGGEDFTIHQIRQAFEQWNPARTEELLKLLRQKKKDRKWKKPLLKRVKVWERAR